MVDSDFLALPAAGPDPLFQQIRAISVPMGQLRQRVNAQLSNVANADADVDFVQLQRDLQQLDVLHGQLAGAIAQFRASPAYQADAQTAALLDNWLNFAGAWAEDTLRAVVQLGVDGVQGVTDALGNILANTTKSLFSGLTPLLIGGGLLLAAALFGVKKAETTRTYRRYVA